MYYHRFAITGQMLEIIMIILKICIVLGSTRTTLSTKHMIYSV